MKLCEVIKVGSEKEIRFLGMSVAEFGCRKFTFSESISYEKYFNIFPLKGIRECFFDNILAQLDEDYDDIYISRMAAIGDSYFFNLLFNNLIKKNGSKKPVVVSLNQNTVEIFNLFSPDVECKIVEFNKRLALEIFYNDIENKGFEYKGKRFFSYINKELIYNIHRDIRNSIKNNDGNFSFIHHLQKYYALFNSNFSYPSISSVAREKVFDFIRSSGLNMNKFIFLSPLASSNCSYDKSFWQALCIKLKSKGYDIFINSSVNKLEIDGCVCGLLDLEETYYLAQLSKGIIALRSGLNDFLSTVDVPQHILYTKFKCNVVSSAEENIKQFSLKYLPAVNPDNLFEYNTELQSEAEIERMILERIK